MSARFQLGATTPKHNRPLTASELERLRTEEKQFHRLQYRPGSTCAYCRCGFLLRDVTKRDVQIRHDMHVHEVMEVFEERWSSYGN
ncbi:MAG: hypothetical protein NDI90_04305 [Nitrospira sp. BO4]|jgi:hypothetical protein|nr:hypothetical protein [Nitrospira sp. BO4]